MCSSACSTTTDAACPLIGWCSASPFWCHYEDQRGRRCKKKTNEHTARCTRLLTTCSPPPPWLCFRSRMAVKACTSMLVQLGADTADDGLHIYHAVRAVHSSQAQAHRHTHRGADMCLDSSVFPSTSDTRAPFVLCRIFTTDTLRAWMSFAATKPKSSCSLRHVHVGFHRAHRETERQSDRETDTHTPSLCAVSLLGAQRTFRLLSSTCKRKRIGVTTACTTRQRTQPSRSDTRVCMCVCVCPDVFSSDSHSLCS